MSTKFGLIPHCAWKRNGSELAEAAGDDRAPEAVDPADQRRREQRQRVLRLERLRGRLADLRREQAAGDTRHEGREREGPELVEDDVDARRERCRLALADRRPGAAGLALTWSSAMRNISGGDDDDVAVVGGVALGDARPAHGLEPGEVGRARSPGEAAAAVREVDRDQHDVHRPGGHQRDQREVEPREADRREPDEHADAAGDRPGDEEQDGEGEVDGEVEAGRGPDPDHEQRHLSERDQPDAAVQHPEPECDHRVDRDTRKGGRPVGADRREDEEGNREEHRDRKDTHDRRPVEEGRAAANRSRPGVGVASN